MLIPLVARSGARPCGERYAAWEAALESLRDAWRRGPVAGSDLPRFVASLPEDQRDGAFRDVVAVHLRLAWRAGPGPRLEDLGLSLQAATELAEDEFLARYQPPHGDTPRLEEYRRRFPGATALEGRHLAGGRFALLARLGAGASGEVREAFDHERRVRVAIKRTAAGGDLLSREARALARLEHPGIVALREVRPAGEECLVLALAPGRTLAERAAELHRAPARGPLRALVGSFAAACEAIAHAHARGVVHLDLKAGHVLAGDGARPVVVDWGLARCPGEPPPGAPVGTPESMAPEQADGLGDERSDAFGLGAVLFEILFGRPPRRWPDGVRPAGWRRIVREGGVDWPRSVPRWIGSDLVELCRSALALRGADRPDAEELARRARVAAGTGEDGLVRRAFRRIFRSPE